MENNRSGISVTVYYEEVNYRISCLQREASDLERSAGLDPQESSKLRGRAKKLSEEAQALSRAAQKYYRN